MSFYAKAPTLFVAATMLATVGAVSAAPTGAHAGERLSGSEIEALFPGQFEAVWKDKRRVSIKAGSDGDVRGRTGILSDSGQWSVRGDQLCVAFYWWTGNKPRCTEVIVGQDGWYAGMLRSNGKPKVRFRPL